MTLLASALPIPDPHPLMMLPFGLLLGAIALGPLLAPHQWEAHYAKIAVGLGFITVAYYFFSLHAGVRVLHSMEEYVSFMALIGSLYVVSGGIQISVRGEATPLRNVVFLFAGAVVSNLVGTTGASMLLIRPWMKMNRFRYTAFHTVFFIFIVSNTGGCLTPIGDPPLFLGYLKGVPFLWNLGHLWLPWLLTIGAILAVFFWFDVRNFARVPADIAQAETATETFIFRGKRNIAFIGVILAAVFCPPPWREAIMIGIALVSYLTTPRPIYEANDFSFGPIKEVAWLFLGIFATMVPALDYLGLHANDFGISQPLQFYFLTGALSAVLDNAPTYLTFLTTAIGQVVDSTDPSRILSIDSVPDVHAFIALRPDNLIAISLGAVFFGAMTYIGNGPNLLVKAIVDRAGLKAPHFLEYVYKYSLPILLPILILGGFVLVFL